MFHQIYPLFQVISQALTSYLFPHTFFFSLFFHYFSKKDSHQRQNELLEGISPALLELIEKIAEELLFDKGGCQLVLAALLQCAGGFS